MKSKHIIEQTKKENTRDNKPGKDLRDKIFSYLPFIFFGLGTFLISRFSDDTIAQKRILYFVTIFLAANALLAKKNNHTDYFTYGMAFAGVVLLVISSISENLQALVFHKFPVGIYGGMFLAAVVPLLLKRDPFTYYHSAHKYRAAIVQTALFKKINQVITMVWAVLLFIAGLTMFINYSESELVQNFVSNSLPVGIVLLGFPVNNYLPDWLRRRYETHSSKTNESLF